MSPAIFPPWVDRAHSNLEEIMPRNDTIRILAAFGGGEPIDITPQLAEFPTLLTVTVGLAQRAASYNLVQRLADCNEIEDDDQRRRQLLDLVKEAARRVEAHDPEAERKLRELGAEATRWLEAAHASRARNFRVVGETKAVKPRSTPVRVGRGRPAATGAREAANGEPARPDAADGRERPGREPGRRARGPIDRRHKPGTPRD
jgi:hypothetical protein